MMSDGNEETRLWFQEELRNRRLVALGILNKVDQSSQTDMQYICANTVSQASSSVVNNNCTWDLYVSGMTKDDAAKFPQNQWEQHSPALAPAQRAGNAATLPESGPRPLAAPSNTIIVPDDIEDDCELPSFREELQLSSVPALLSTPGSSRNTDPVVTVSDSNSDSDTDTAVARAVSLADKHKKQKRKNLKMVNSFLDDYVVDDSSDDSGPTLSKKPAVGNGISSGLSDQPNRKFICRSCNLRLPNARLKACGHVSCDECLIKLKNKKCAKCSIPECGKPFRKWDPLYV